MRAQLIPIDGDDAIEITQDVTLVGRKRDICDLTLDRSSISKLHCVIVKTDGLLFIRDLGSTNGTKVNGQRVTRGALLPGDELAFAGTRFRVHLGPGDALVGHHDHTEFIPEVDESTDDDNADSVPLDDDVLDGDSLLSEKDDPLPDFNIESGRRNRHDNDMMMPDDSFV